MVEGGTVKKSLASFLDVCFVLDGTGSMDDWIEGVRKSLDEILNAFTSRFIRVAAVIYRDKVPEMDEEFKNLIDLTDYKPVEVLGFVPSESIEKVKEFLTKAKCEHGWDKCEDMKIGLQSALNLEWKSKDQFLILVTDSPTHGKKFNCGCLDEYPEDDITPELEKLKEKKINLVALQIDKKTTQPMFDVFKTILSGDNFQICNLDLKDNMKEIIEKITKSVTGSIKMKL